MSASNVAVVITGVVAATSLGWQMATFLMTRSSDARNREFEAYHRLIKELVQPSEDGNTYIARQCAALFELRRFRRYWEITARILNDVDQSWERSPQYIGPLKRELQATVNHICTNS
jgi:hypothetical protein